MEKTLVNVLASTVDAYHNCVRHGNSEWKEKHWDSLMRLADFLPSGSGFDNRSAIDVEKSTGDKLVFQTSFHHMNGAGYYDGWTEHRVTVTPSFIGNLNIKVSGRDRNAIKEHIDECFRYALNKPMGYRCKNCERMFSTIEDASEHRANPAASNCPGIPELEYWPLQYGRTPSV